MPAITINDERLDDDAQSMLCELAEADDNRLTTEQLRKRLPGLDNGKVRYRAGKFVKADLATKRRQKNDEAGNKASIVTLTEEGLYVAETRASMDGEETVAEQVKRHERALQRRDERIEDLEATVDELQERLDDAAGDRESVAERLYYLEEWAGKIELLLESVMGDSPKWVGDYFGQKLDD